MPAIVLAAANDAEHSKMLRGLAGLAISTNEWDPRRVGRVETAGRYRTVAERRALSIGGLPDDWFVLAAYGGLSIPALGGELARPRPATVAEAEALVAWVCEGLAGLADADRVVFWVQALALARNGAVVASWDTAGPPGVLRDLAAVPDPPDRWFADAWWWPQFGRPSSQLTADEFRSVDVGWVPLWAHLRACLREQGVTFVNAPG
jgi:hypothetical protein